MFSGNINKIKETFPFKWFVRFSVIFLFSFFYPACLMAQSSTGIVKKGDPVLVDFTCRLDDGAVVITTNESVAGDKSRLKEGVFLPFKKYSPAGLIAGSGKSGPDYGKLKSFENEIFECLSNLLTGMKEGSSNTYKIVSEVQPGLSENERFLRLSRIRIQPKEVRLKPDLFKRNYGRDPVQGDIIYSDEFEGLATEVLSVLDDEITVKLNMKEGMKLPMPLGTGTVHDAGKKYKTVIDVYPGKLIRSGVIVGRVVDIEDEMFTIDYGHPFGHETLSCDVKVVKILKNDSTQKSKDKK